MLRCVKPLGLTLGVLVGCILAARVPWGCGPQKGGPYPQGPLSASGVPAIRVLIAPQPLPGATISTSGAYRLEVDGRCVIESDGALPPTLLHRAGRTWRLNLLEYEGDECTLQPATDAVVCIGQLAYRGHMRFLPFGENSFYAVNHVDMESYLAGVLAKELYPYWSVETYRAQAVAARTFAMYQRLTFGPSHFYDLGFTQASQVYEGFSAETDKSWQAVRSKFDPVPP